MEFGRAIREPAGSGRKRPSLFTGLAVMGVAVFSATFLSLVGLEYVMRTPGISGYIHDTAIREVEQRVSNFDAPSRGRGERLGEAELASAFDTCADYLEAFNPGEPGTKPSSQLAYFLIRRGNRPADYVANVGPFIECAIDRNPADLCDPDNRALVVESVGRFLRLDDQAVEAIEKGKARPGRERTQGQRERILLVILAQARAGRLTRSDFGRAPHEDLQKILDGAELAVDSCAP